MAKQKDDALAKQEQAGAITTNELPDFLKEFQGRQLGTEGVEAADLTMPRVALCQDLTPQRKKQDPKFIPGLDVGMYFNTVSGKIYGEVIYFVPVKFSKAQMYCKPLNEGGGIICQSMNGKTGGKLSPSCETCEHNSWADGKPDCGKLMNFLGLVFENKSCTGEPIDAAVLTFKSTSLKVGKQLNSLIRIANVPSFGKVYEVRSASETRNSNSFYGHKLIPVGFVPQEIFLAAKELYEAYKDRDLQVDEGAGQDDTEGGGTDFETKDF